jgi:hypothetical protein
MLRVLPEGLAAAAAQLEALTAQLAAAHGAAIPAITAGAPPAADPVSLEAAAAFSAHGSRHAAVATEAAQVLGRSGVGVGESGTSYAAGDAAAAASYWVAQG